MMDKRMTDEEFKLEFPAPWDEKTRSGARIYKADKFPELKAEAKRARESEEVLKKAAMELLGCLEFNLLDPGMDAEMWAKGTIRAIKDYKLSGREKRGVELVYDGKGNPFDERRIPKWSEG